MVDLSPLIETTPSVLRQDVLAAWEHYQSTGLHVTGEEADRWLAKLETGKCAAPPECHKR